ncbi:MAG: thrombospondin type 3 repeat-containing protein [Myxococcota bacterium]|nr:thrombospondin type 3 repeat-containing protein [Myxococcota bacterium]
MIRKCLLLFLILFLLPGCDDSSGASGTQEPDIGFDLDRDDDGITDAEDNCPAVYNPDQQDLDGDSQGDLCDYDDDGDGVLDEADGCPFVPDPLRIDTDGDGIGDACDDDDDADGIADDEDACPLDPRFAVGDLDGDGRGDACDRDRDGDGVDNDDDNCPDALNASQDDVDGDGFGNECDVDVDGDGVANVDDNCRLVANPQQEDLDDDNIGNECDSDVDGDGVDNVVDNCPFEWEPGQADTDQDGLGNVCDPCPTDMFDDIDGDGLCATEDNCPDIANLEQNDVDGDGRGDECDPCPTDRDNDRDQDGFCGGADNCPNIPNLDQSDLDGDGLGDSCDLCPLDLNNDEDGDSICGEVDKCPAVADPEQADFDGDGLGDFCDRCPADATNDPDRDNVCNDIDLCPDVPDPDQRDRDGDGLGDACDGCLLGGGSDPDRDGVCDVSDNCPRFRNPDQLDTDADGLGDVCDLCPNDGDNDLDEDGLCGDLDVCPSIPDPAQDDADGDGIGDRCDDDIDGDLVNNDDDNCPFLSNADQANTFGGPPGDVCELLFFYEDFECEDGVDDCNPIAGWEQSGRWVYDESAAKEGDFGLVEGNNQRTQIVAINSPPIDLTRSERPRLTFWVRRQANQAFFVDVFVDRNLRDSFRVVGSGNADRTLPNGYELYTFDLRGFEGRDGVRLRFRMTGQGGFGRLSFDEITVDENPRPPSVGIPFREQFDSLEDWRVAENGWTLGGPAWTPEFAATLPAGPAKQGTSIIELRWGIDLRATRDPRLVVWSRTGAALRGLQRLEVVIDPENAAGKTEALLRGDGNTLFSKSEISLLEQVGDPDVRIRFIFYHEGHANPAVFLDSLAIEEKPRPEPPVLTPFTVDFPSDKVEMLTEGWDVVRGVNGRGRLVTTMQNLPLASKAKVRIGSFDLTGLRNPLLRVFARYQLRARSQALRVLLKPLEFIDRQYTLISSNAGGQSGVVDRFDIPLNQVRGDRALNLEFLVETGTAGADAGVEIERVELIEDPSRNNLNALNLDDFEDGSLWDPVSGSWTVVPQVGVDGSRGLLAQATRDENGWGGQSVLELGGRLDFTNVVNPRIEMDANFLTMANNQRLHLSVESRDLRQTIRLARFGDNTRRSSEGYQRLEQDLSAFAGQEDVVIRFEVVGQGDYTFMLDNIAITGLGEELSGLLQVDSQDPYVAYFNGEEVTRGNRYRVAEAARVTPRIGTNVLAIEGDFDSVSRKFVAALDLGLGFHHVTGRGGWVGSDRADFGWNGTNLGAAETQLGDFEDRADFIGLGEALPDQDAWRTTGNAWGVRPDSVGSFGQVIGGLGGTYAATSSEGGAQALGHLYSKPFTLDRGFLHFRLAGGAYADGHEGGCTCARLWRLDEAGDRAELLGSWTAANSTTLEWQRFAVLEEHEGAEVQLEFADESVNNFFGFLIADDVYLSDVSSPRGVWMNTTRHAAAGRHENNVDWPLMNLGLGARWISGAQNSHRYFRFEFEVEDSDGDGIADPNDLCPDDPDAAQLDTNHNGIGDACDTCPDCENVAAGLRATGTSVYNNNYNAQRVTDGAYHGTRSAQESDVAYDYWLLRARNQGHVEVNLMVPHRICSVRWMNTNNSGTHYYSTADWRLSIFNGDVETQVDEGSEPELPALRWITTQFDECQIGNRVRFYVDSWNESGGGISELEIYGEPFVGP